MSDDKEFSRAVAEYYLNQQPDTRPFKLWTFGYIPELGGEMFAYARDEFDAAQALVRRWINMGSETDYASREVQSRTPIEVTDRVLVLSDYDPPY